MLAPHHAQHFPSFSEGLSLRSGAVHMLGLPVPHFPSFSEGLSLRSGTGEGAGAGISFPFLFGGTFIEESIAPTLHCGGSNFPSFSEGLSLRSHVEVERAGRSIISLPFRRDFH